MSKVHNFKELFVHELQDIYDAERQIIEAMPKMVEKTTSKDLKSAFNQHLEQTKRQSLRLEKLFQRMEVEPEGEPCRGMQGLIREGENMMRNVKDPNVLNAALIAAAQRIEHYEIAGYGTARTWAEQIGDKEAARILDETLAEEKETDKRLTQLAVAHINPDAKNR